MAIGTDPSAAQKDVDILVHLAPTATMTSEALNMKKGRGRIR
jgi:hypothetical protein